MTVTVLQHRGGESPNMSLFQDLKLKRRKVDSRCSSEAESFEGTSSTSPPDNSDRSETSGCSSPTLQG